MLEDGVTSFASTAGADPVGAEFENAILREAIPSGAILLL